jgi:hypothetical protein
MKLPFGLTPVVLFFLWGCTSAPTGAPSDSPRSFEEQTDEYSKAMLREGRRVFRHDTFGSEEFWGGKLRLHEAIAGTRNGGSGPGLTPRQALQLGLKVDVAALPPTVVEAIKGGKADLDSADTTLALLQVNAVLGVTGLFDSSTKRMTAIGIQCALCHSTVDDSLTKGIGRRLDGWPNRDLNVGEIVAFAPTLKPFADLLRVDEATVRTVLKSWGPGRYDAELNQDGKAFRPDRRTAATLLPAAFGLAGVNLHTYSGWGSVSHWNAYVANTQMHGKGTFFDPRLNDAERFPVAARAGHGNIRNTPDLVTPSWGRSTTISSRCPRPSRPRARSTWRRPRGVRRQGALRRLPRAPALHGARVADARGRGDRDRRLPGEPVARQALLPDHPAARALHAHQGRLLSRRPLRHPRGGGGALHAGARPRAQRGGDGRPGAVPEVTLG